MANAKNEKQKEYVRYAAYCLNMVTTAKIGTHVRCT